MTPDKGLGLDEEQLAVSIREADAAYTSISDFASWKGLLVATDIWKRYSQLLQNERSAATDESIRAAQEIALRAAAVDTGAIEGLYETDRGFTMSVATQAAGWEVQFEDRGTNARELFEAQLEAFEMVLDAATENRPITEMWIRQLHEVSCRPQRKYSVRTPQGLQEHALPKGEYKSHPNHVYLGEGRFHAYAPVNRVTQEMQRLVEQLQTAEFQNAHPVIQAAYAHFTLVAVHPFADGNGRVARALASVFFYRAESIPLLVYVDQKAAYYDALRSADDGIFEPFVRFIFDRGLDALGELRLNLQVARTSSEVTLRDLQELQKGYGGLTHSELDAVAARLQALMTDEVSEQMNAWEVPDTLTFRVSGGSGRLPISMTGFSVQAHDPKYSHIALQNAAPASANIERVLQVLIARDRSQYFAFVVVVPNYEDVLEVRLQDVYPQETAAFRNRLKLWVQNLLSRALAELAVQAAQTLNQGGS